MTGGGENQIYYYHEKTYPCEQSDLTTVMYGIPMGFNNQGELVSAAEAMEKTEYILGKLAKENSGKNIYVDQFIYADNTPAFKNNAQIQDDELDDYLLNVYKILQAYTWGYGIWTYRDYCANMIYNPQFSLDLSGWEVEGKVECIEDESRKLLLEADSKIRQHIPEIRNHFPADEYTIEFDVEIIEDTEISISLGNLNENIQISESGTYAIRMGNQDCFDFELQTNKKCVIDNLKLYSQVQNGFLYDKDGNELSQIKNIRRLNNLLIDINAEVN